MGQKTDNARALYLEGIRDGNARAAVTRYIGDRYTQHSTGVRDGAEGFLEFFEPFLVRNTKRDIRILRAIEDGRFVFLHAAQSLNGGEARWITMDMFDTDESDRIVEHWDVIAPWPEETVSGADPIAGPAGPDEAKSPAEAERSKARVRTLLTEAFQNGDLEVLEQLVAPDLVSHASDVAAGRQGLRDWLAAGRRDDSPFGYDFVFKVLGQGDLVVSYSKLLRGGDEFAVFDLWRLDNELIVEHWANRERIGPRETWGNSGKF